MIGRNLVKVVDEIVAIAPDIEDVLRGRRQSTLYTAPEIMHLRWNEVAAILNEVAVNHPKAEEIAAIFSGKATP